MEGKKYIQTYVISVLQAARRSILFFFLFLSVNSRFLTHGFGCCRVNILWCLPSNVFGCLVYSWSVPIYFISFLIFPLKSSLLLAGVVHSPPAPVGGTGGGSAFAGALGRGSLAGFPRVGLAGVDNEPPIGGKKVVKFGRCFSLRSNSLSFLLRNV